MIKNRKDTSYKNRSRNKKSNSSKSSKVFMKKSFISPSLQINELNDENLIESPAPVASQPLSSDEHIDNMDIDQNEFDENTDSYDDNSDSYSASDNDEEQYIDKENDSYATSIKNKDLRIFKMKFILEEKRKQMFEKEQEVRELQKYNSFLESVITDYENYNRSILEEKNKQKTAIKILSDHIRDISKEMKTGDYKLNRVKGDQRILLDELQNLRNELREAFVLNGRDNEYISSDDDEYN